MRKRMAKIKQYLGVQRDKNLYVQYFTCRDILTCVQLTLHAHIEPLIYSTLFACRTHRFRCYALRHRGCVRFLSGVFRDLCTTLTFRFMRSVTLLPT